MRHPQTIKRALPPRTHIDCVLRAGIDLGALRRNFISPSPLPFRAFAEKFSRCFHDAYFFRHGGGNPLVKDTPSSFASRCAAFLVDSGSFKGYVDLLIVSPS